MEEETKLTEILVGIGTLGAKMDATNEHLARLNGSVQTLYGKAESNRLAIEGAERSLLQHQIDCPGLRTINEIDRKLASGDFHGSVEVRERLMATEIKDAERRGKAETNRDWFKLLQPWVTWVILAVLIMIVMHYQQIASKIAVVK
jgi:hypothetical protein